MFLIVMPGQKREARLRADVPGIDVFAAGFTDVDGRDKPGHDEKIKDNGHSGMVRRTRPQMCNCTSGNL